ncbi:hypothetical protein LEP1GSC061_3690 [Leptospira wolffii serovar Khorat str. Khorat-H2]|nr:hypothetical protein LEP1GSC061_3690 [Leptospira wolffii serovar Khorat str. Khorat-H2]
MRNIMKDRIRLVFCLVLVFILFSNCAIFNRKNTPLVVKVEEHLIPEDTGPRILAAPIYIPLGLVAGILDLFIVHPIIRIPDAYRDTIQVLWTPHPENGYVTRMAFLPIVTALTPFFFTGDLLIRSSFDVNGNVDRTRIEQNSIPKKTVEEALESGDKETIIALLKLPVHNWPPELTVKVIERFSEDQEIVGLAVIRLAETGKKSKKIDPRYDSYLIRFLGRNEDIDSAICRYFESIRSEAGANALVSILLSRKVASHSEELYTGTVIAVGKSKPILELLSLNSKNAEKRRNFVREFNYRFKRQYNDENVSESILLLNKDSQIDEILCKYFAIMRSAMASQALLKLLVSGQANKASAKYYILAILQIGVEKDVQLVVDRFTSQPPK